ncbi:MAG: hypothetical protein GYB65_16600 [Chloroflexi bacterium]|nr:hypothetical protein [Chloroflexota bacterium]
MAMIDKTPVMDISPWPAGRGFEGATDWWEHVMDSDEKQRLDHLMGVALLDADIRDRLVNERDASLFTAFGLSQDTQTWLREIRAYSLIELAQAIVSRAQSEAFAGS